MNVILISKLVHDEHPLIPHVSVIHGKLLVALRNKDCSESGIDLTVLRVVQSNTLLVLDRFILWFALAVLASVFSKSQVIPAMEDTFTAVHQCLLRSEPRECASALQYLYNAVTHVGAVCRLHTQNYKF